MHFPRLPQGNCRRRQCELSPWLAYATSSHTASCSLLRRVQCTAAAHRLFANISLKFRNLQHDRSRNRVKPMGSLHNTCPDIDFLELVFPQSQISCTTSFEQDPYNLSYRTHDWWRFMFHGCSNGSLISLSRGKDCPSRHDS